MREKALLLLIILSAVTVAAYTVIEGRVQVDATRVDFTYHSSVEEVQGVGLKIVNFIHNNRNVERLSVVWKEAGILGVGFGQIPPRATVRGSNSIEAESVVPVESTIQYGIDLKQEQQTKVYVDPQREIQRDASRTKTSLYVVEADDGAVPLKIEITSSLDADERASDLVFRVQGDIDLAVPMALGGELKTNAGVLGSRTWKLVEPMGFGTLSLRDGSYRELSQNWLRTNDRIGYLNYVLLSNFSAPQPNELSLRLAADRWKLERVYLIGVNRERTGMVGMAADIYLPDRP